MKIETPNSIDFGRVLKYMGQGNSTNEISDLLLTCQEKVLKTASPRLHSVEYDSIPDFLVRGNDIKKHLENCYGVIIYAVTLGTEIDRLIRCSGFSSPVERLATDALSSVLVEQISEEYERRLRIEREKMGEFLTMSYAAGYGDYPLEILKSYLTALDAYKKIGLSINDSYIMIPKKSISACIGRAKIPVKGYRSDCTECKMIENCKLNKEGKCCVR